MAIARKFLCTEHDDVERNFILENEDLIPILSGVDLKYFLFHAIVHTSPGQLPPCLLVPTTTRVVPQAL